MGKYIPQKGDLIYLNLNPQVGHEQKGRRPSLVISNGLFNKATGLSMICPITNTDRDIPFHIKLPDDSGLYGFVMVEQIKSIDYKARKIRFIEKASTEFVDEVLSILEACIY